MATEVSHLAPRVISTAVEDTNEKKLAHLRLREKQIIASLKARRLSLGEDKRAEALRAARLTRLSLPGDASKQSHGESFIAPLKDDCIAYLNQLLQHPAVQSDAGAKLLLEQQVQELTNQEEKELTRMQRRKYRWMQNLLVDEKVSSFVVKKLKEFDAASSNS